MHRAVCFKDEVSVFYVDADVERKGFWTIDALYFRRRVQQLGDVLNTFLDERHRARVLLRRREMHLTNVREEATSFIQMVVNNCMYTYRDPMPRSGWFDGTRSSKIVCKERAARYVLQRLWEIDCHDFSGASTALLEDISIADVALACIRLWMDTLSQYATVESLTERPGSDIYYTVALPGCDTWIIHDAVFTQRAYSAYDKNDERPWNIQDVLHRCVKPFAVHMSCVVRSRLQKIRDNVLSGNRYSLVKPLINNLVLNPKLRTQLILCKATGPYVTQNVTRQVADILTSVETWADADEIDASAIRISRGIDREWISYEGDY